MKVKQQRRYTHCHGSNAVLIAELRSRKASRFSPIKPRPVPMSAYTRRIEREKRMGPGWSFEEWDSLLQCHGVKCLVCGASDNLVPDHVIPMARGGAHHITNIQPLCRGCNFRKGLTIKDYRG